MTNGVQSPLRRLRDLINRLMRCMRRLRREHHWGVGSVEQLLLPDHLTRLLEFLTVAMADPVVKSLLRDLQRFFQDLHHGVTGMDPAPGGVANGGVPNAQPRSGSHACEFHFMHRGQGTRTVVTVYNHASVSMRSARVMDRNLVLFDPHDRAITRIPLASIGISRPVRVVQLKQLSPRYVEVVVTPLKPGP